MSEQPEQTNRLRPAAIIATVAGLLGCCGLLGLCAVVGALLPPPQAGGAPANRGDAPPAVATPPPTLPTYRVVSNELHEDLVKAQAEVRVVATANVTRAGLEALLMDLHDQAKRRTDLRHHNHVGYTLIGVFAPHQRIGEEMPLANLNSIADTGPVIMFDERLLSEIEARGGDPNRPR